MNDNYAFLWGLLAVFAVGVISAILYKRRTINPWSTAAALSRSNDISSGNSENESSSTTSDSVVEPMDIDEASVRREQLTNILRIMNAYDKEFGVTTMDDLLEQAKLYGIKKQ